MMTRLAAASTMPISDGRASPKPRSERTASAATYAASAKKDIAMKPQRRLLPGLGISGGELPGHRGRRRDLDDRVEPEADQRRRRDARALGQRDDRLDHVVGDRCADQQPDSALQCCATRPE